MELREYFENKRGLGVLSTADKNGVVDSAVYARPHVMEDGRFIFIMRDRLSFKNVTENPQVHYLFHENADGYYGKRFFLEMVKYEENHELYEKLSRRNHSQDTDGERKFIVYFKVLRERPLVGD